MLPSRAAVRLPHPSSPVLQRSPCYDLRYGLVPVFHTLPHVCLRLSRTGFPSIRIQPSPGPHSPRRCPTDRGYPLCIEVLASSAHNRRLQRGVPGWYDWSQWHRRQPQRQVRGTQPASPIPITEDEMNIKRSGIVLSALLVFAVFPAWARIPIASRLAGC